VPERLAATSPFKPVAEIIGSGPYRFLPEEHIAGARAAYERFPLYQPRAGGPVGFTSGPKIAHFDRVEWLTLDSFSAMAALHAGEIDWWELPPSDMVEQLALGILRFNHLHPPFNNVAVRRALLGAVDQAEAMTAVAAPIPSSGATASACSAQALRWPTMPGSNFCAGHAIMWRFGRSWRAPVITVN